jgi:hypothetical protein
MSFPLAPKARDGCSRGWMANQWCQTRSQAKCPGLNLNRADSLISECSSSSETESINNIYTLDFMDSFPTRTSQTAVVVMGMGQGGRTAGSDRSGVPSSTSHANGHSGARLRLQQQGAGPVLGHSAAGNVPTQRLARHILRRPGHRTALHRVQWGHPPFVMMKMMMRLITTALLLLLLEEMAFGGERVVLQQQWVTFLRPMHLLQQQFLVDQPNLFIQLLACTLEELVVEQEVPEKLFSLLDDTSA